MTTLPHPPRYQTLIGAAELGAHLDELRSGQAPAQASEDWLIVDCRFDLTAPQAGETAYRNGHIPLAIYAHLDRDLSGPLSPASGRHPLPDPDRFAATLGRWGVSPTTQIIAYDADNGAYAARLWWLLRWVGHRPVAVLDGGFKAWLAAGLPTSTVVPARSASHYEVHPDRDAWLDADQVAQRMRRDDWRLLDARAHERFTGAIEPLDAVGGHVPGALNHPFADNLCGDARFAPPAQIRERFKRSQGDVADDHTIVMCGSGVTACHLLLAMEIAGKHGARLYAGSWSEWIRDPSRPIAGAGTQTA